MIKSKKIVWITILVLTALVFLISYKAISEEEVIAKLNSQQKTATRISVAAGVAATALAAVPDDSTTPVADQIAGVSNYLIIATLAILVEKFLTSVSFSIFNGLLVLVVIIVLLGLISKKDSLRGLSVKLLTLALCIRFLVPAGLWVDNKIDSVLNTSEMINTFIAGSEESEENTEDDDKGFLDSITSFFGNMIDTAVNIGNVAEDLLTNFITAMAAVLLTICVVPVITMIILWKVVKWAIFALISFVTFDDKKQDPAEFRFSTVDGNQDQSDREMEEKADQGKTDD